MWKRKSPEEQGCNLGKMQERYVFREKGKAREILHNARSASEMAYEFLSDCLGVGKIGPDSSYCLNTAWETKKILHSYRQFVPESQRQLSPRILIFPVLSEEFVREVLRKCNVPEEYHINWITEIFKLI